MIRQLCGDGDRDETRVDDYAFSGRLRVTYVAQHLSLGVMMADAAMVEHVIGVDALGDAPERWPARAAQWCADQPGRREIEGMGGQFWYERPTDTRQCLATPSEKGFGYLSFEHLSPQASDFDRPPPPLTSSMSFRQ